VHEASEAVKEGDNMKILQAPDLHCFYDNYGKVLPDGRHTRLVDWERTSSYLLQAAVDNDVDIIVVPGDFFKNSRPGPAQVLAIANLITAATSYGIKVVGCPGNHDLPGAGQSGFCEVLTAICDEEFYYSNVPTVFHFDGVNIAVLPSVKPTSLIDAAADPAEFASLLSQKLVDITRNLMVQCLEYGPDCKNVLIGHWTISGAVASSGQLLYGGTEPVIPLAELLAMEWDAVLFGHIHKAQVLSMEPFVGYAGALERVDFGEEEDQRGCYIHDLDNGSYEWEDLPARDFCTISANIKTTDDIQKLYNRLSDTMGGYAHIIDIKDAIVRMKYKISEELAPMMDHSKLLQLINASAPEYIAGIFPEVVRSERSREASVTEETGPIEALSKWLDTKDICGENKDKILTRASIMVMEVLAE
jgi:exonuclease SbcD